MSLPLNPVDIAYYYKLRTLKRLVWQATRPPGHHIWPTVYLGMSAIHCKSSLLSLSNDNAFRMEFSKVGGFYADYYERLGNMACYENFI